MGTSDELTLFWQNSNDGYVAKHRVFDYYGSSGQYYMDSAARGVHSGNLGTAENGYYPGTAFDTISGDFNGDGYDNIIAAWETKDSSINIVVPKNIDKSSLTWNDENSLTLTNVLYPNVRFSAHKFKLIKGFFDSDPEPEFVLAFWNKDGNIEIRVYNVDPNNGGTLIQSTDNKSEFTTGDYIPQRGNSIISFDWKIPNDLPHYPKNLCSIGSGK